jgi:hypothetical protein
MQVFHRISVHYSPDYSGWSVREGHAIPKAGYLMSPLKRYDSLIGPEPDLIMSQIDQVITVVDGKMRPLAFLAEMFHRGHAVYGT